jgi:uncharacterized protein YjbJ (UPF0337 family)
MNEDTIKGNWKILKGKVRETWGDLTDDDVTQLSGKKDQLVGTVQKKYGIAREEAEKQVDAWAKKHSKNNKDSCNTCN